MTEIIAKFGTEIASALAPLLIAGVLYGIHRLTAWLKAKTTNEQIQGALNVVDNLAATVVQQLQQTMVSVLKEAATDGKLTDEEKAKIKATAIETLKKIYGEQGLASLQKVLGLGEEALMAFLTGKLEAAVYALPKAPELPEAMALAAELGKHIKPDPMGATLPAK